MPIREKIAFLGIVRWFVLLILLWLENIYQEIVQQTFILVIIFFLLKYPYHCWNQNMFWLSVFSTDALRPKSECGIVLFTECVSGRSIILKMLGISSNLLLFKGWHSVCFSSCLLFSKLAALDKHSPGLILETKSFTVNAMISFIQVFSVAQAKHSWNLKNQKLHFASTLLFSGYAKLCL